MINVTSFPTDRDNRFVALRKALVSALPRTADKDVLQLFGATLQVALNEVGFDVVKSNGQSLGLKQDSNVVAEGKAEASKKPVQRRKPQRKAKAGTQKKEATQEPEKS